MIDIRSTIHLKLNHDLDIELTDNLEEMLDIDLYCVIIAYIYEVDNDAMNELADEINAYFYEY